MKTKNDIRHEALAAIGDLRMAGVEISMGIGKTRIGLYHMAKYFTDICKFLVVAPTTAIYKSWKEEIELVGLEYLLSHITFTTYRSLTKHDFDYDYIYLDECHSLKASHNKWLLEYLKNNGRLLGLTGTYPTSKSSEKGKMCNFYCPKVYRYMIDDAVTDNILNDYVIYVHELELSNKMNIQRTGVHGDFMSSELKDYHYWCNKLEAINISAKEAQMLRIHRMKCLQKFSSKEKYGKLLFNAQNEKTIIFANTMEQADNISTYSYHSGNDKSELNLESFCENRILKLSAVEQLSQGVNIPGLKVGIILHSYSNNRKSAQRIGRLLRLNPNDKATIHILCYVNSVDKDWVTEALKDFDQSKIKWIKPLYYAGIHY
jgi:superfamily II DNA or RNA helicase